MYYTVPFEVGFVHSLKNYFGGVSAAAASGKLDVATPGNAKMTAWTATPALLGSLAGPNRHKEL